MSRFRFEPFAVRSLKHPATLRLPAVLVAAILLMIVQPGCGKAGAGGGGGGGGHTGGGLLAIQAGPANPAGRTISGCLASESVLQFELFLRPGEEVLVESVTFTAWGTGHDVVDIAAVWLVSDNNGNGMLDGSDAVLGGPQPYSGDDGTVTFSGLGRLLTSAASDLWLLAYDLAGGTAAGLTFTAWIESNSDLVATGLQTGGAVAVIGAPVSGTVVIGAPVLLSAIYEDLNGNGFIDPPDSLILTFSGPVTFNGGPQPDDIFVLDPPGTFGWSVLGLKSGPTPEQVEIEPRWSSTFEPNGTYPTDPQSSGVNVWAAQWYLRDCAGMEVQPLPSPIDIEGDLHPRIDSVEFDGSVIELTFTSNVTISTPDPAQAFQFPVSGDTLGTGAQFLGGGAPSNVGQVSIVLGTNPILEPVGLFDPAVLSPGSPSGLDITGAASVIVDAGHPGVSALPLSPAGLDLPFVFPPIWSSSGDDQAAVYFGFAVASAGDANNDGYPDIIIGAPGYDSGPTGIGVGKAYLYLGGVSGLSASPAWTSLGDNQEVSDYGFSVASAGDVNNDGFSDVIVGAPDFNTANSDAGKAYLYLGEAGGLASTPAWTSNGDDQEWAEFGYSVASAGDVNNDGFSDVIVGADEFDTVNYRAGKAYIYLGGAAGLSAGPVWTSSGDDQRLAEFGYSVAGAGDVDNDGYDDVIVGAWDFDTLNSGAGKAYVYLGGPLGPSGSPVWTSSGDDQGSAGYGRSVASAGDVNDDGYADVIVGAYDFNATNNQAGKAYVYLGGPGGPSASPVWTSSGDDQQTAHYGISVASAGDVNNDGYSDLIVGASDFNELEVDIGKAYVYLGGPAGPAAVPYWTGSGDNQARAFFGWSVAAAGDVNNDGGSEVIVGARSFDGPQGDEGKVYVYDVTP